MRAANAALCFILILLFRVAPASAGWALRTTGRHSSDALDPEQCYRVRDLFLEREDVKFYFVDGHLILARPFAGRTFAALFVAGDAADRGEIILFSALQAGARVVSALYIRAGAQRAFPQRDDVLHRRHRRRVA